MKDIHASSEEKFVLFISCDSFLREALDKLLGSFEDYFSHESLDEALSTIKLKEEKLTKAFATQIQKRAQKKFFDINNQKTLWYKDEIPYKITEKYPEQLKPVEIEGAFSGGLFGQGSSLPEWNSSSEGRWFLEQTTFSKREEDNTYHWISPLLYQQRFKKIKNYSREGSTLLTGLLTGESQAQQTPLNSEKLLTARFNVHWHSEVKVDKRFYNLIFDEIQAIGQDFEPIKDNSS